MYLWTFFKLLQAYLNILEEEEVARLQWLSENIRATNACWQAAAKTVQSHPIRNSIADENHLY